MKKIIFLFALFILTTITYSQKKDKIKGSKIVTTQIKKIENFLSLEVDDNLEVYLVKGSECGLEIEADDNLHEVIDAKISGSTLRLSTLKSVFGFKKLSIRVTYTSDFNQVVSRNESTVSAIADIELDNISFKSYDYSKLVLSSKSKNFSLIMDDKSKGEVTTKGETTIINLSKNATLKATISTTNLTLDLYQKSNALIAGDAQKMNVRLDNNSSLEAKDLVVKNVELTCEAYSTVNLLVNENIIIDASGKSEIQLYGDQKIEMKRFVDNAVLIKKPTK
ncbi:GIN domain-containing protein [Flavobacterium sp.]|uniref:GIN domain-containing protein n=1 Tax=Flavobacterium sp. TaxID=239 RepID=UPI003BD13495